MLKEPETKETIRFFATVFSFLTFLFGVRVGPLGPLLPTPMDIRPLENKQLRYDLYFGRNIVEYQGQTAQVVER